MHIITDIKESRAFVKNMGQSLSDTAYWQTWYVLDITATTPLDWIKQAKITTLLRARLPDEDGTILWLDGAVLMVFRGGTPPDISTLREALNTTFGAGVLQLTLMNVVEDVPKMADLLTRRQGPKGEHREAPTANFTFLKSLVPNIEELLRTWHKDKSVREGRKRPVIMLVDDDPVVLTLAGRVLAREYIVITAQSGAEAIAKHLQQMPDIIFLDIGLPDCDGITLLNYMQQYDCECRIVMFSGDDFVKTRVSALAGGAKGFLPKPFNLPAFQKQISAWLSGNRTDAS